MDRSARFYLAFFKDNESFQKEKSNVPFRKYPVLQSLLNLFRLSQQKTVALFITSIAEEEKSLK